MSPLPPLPSPTPGPGYSGPLSSYTHCTERSDYKDQPDFSGWDPASFVIESCAYGQGGKLVCLPVATPADPRPNRYRCAIGRVIEIEGVGYDKVGFDAMDNDWSINLLLAPQELSDFTPKVDPTGARTARPYAENRKSALDSVPQGPLLYIETDSTKPVAMPPPHENKDWSKDIGQQVEYFYDQADNPVLFHFDIGQPVPLDVGPNWLAMAYNPLEDARDKARDALKQAFGVDVTLIPVLHCEVEGSREHDFCAVAVPLAEGAKAFSDGCHAALGWVPFGIGDAVCKFLSAVVSWIAALAGFLAGLATWGFAHPGDEVVGGLINLGDLVILSGRWVFDAAHEGQNELHPVLTAQKLPFTDYSSIGDLTQFCDDWCALVSEAPPPDGLIGSVGLPLTPGQQATHDNQQQPPQRWQVHPAVDGCQGSVDLSFSPPPAESPPPPIR